MARGGSRPNSGRKPKPDRDKAIGSKPSKTASALTAPDASTAEPIACPYHLSDLAKLHFGTIVETLRKEGRATPHHTEHYALLAQRLEQIQRYQAVIEVEGDTYTSETPRKVGEQTVIVRMIRARPEVSMMSEAMRQAQSLLGELLLNPAAATRIMTGHSKADNEFDEF